MDQLLSGVQVSPEVVGIPGTPGRDTADARNPPEPPASLVFASLAEIQLNRGVGGHYEKTVRHSAIDNCHLAIVPLASRGSPERILLQPIPPRRSWSGPGSSKSSLRDCFRERPQECLFHHREYIGGQKREESFWHVWRFLSLDRTAVGRSRA